MRRFRILLAEVIGLGLLLGWLIWKYPELVDDIIPWVALVICWHVTWEYVLDTNFIRTQAIVLGRRVSPLVAWPVVVLVGATVSLVYWWGINKGLAQLAVVAHRVPVGTPSPQTQDLMKGLEIRPPLGDDAYHFTEQGHGETHYRMEVYNGSGTALRVQVKLTGIEPLPRSALFTSHADFPYWVRPAHLADGTVDGATSHEINAGTSESFELLFSWISSDGRTMIDGVDTKQEARNARFPIEDHEQWRMEYEVSCSQDCGIQRPVFLVRREGRNLVVSRTEDETEIQKPVPAGGGALVEYGFYPSTNLLSAQVNTAKLGFSDPYKFLVIVYVRDDTVDEYEDKRIEKSTAFAIDRETRTVEIRPSDAFLSRLAHGGEIEFVVAVVPPSLPLERITTLKDVSEMGGRLIVSGGIGRVSTQRNRSARN